MTRHYIPDEAYPAGARPCAFPGCPQVVTARSSKLCRYHREQLAAEAAEARTAEWNDEPTEQEARQ